MVTLADSTPSLASTRSQSARSRVVGDQLHDSEQTEDKHEDWEVGRMICQNGWRNSLKTQWTTKLKHQAMHRKHFS